MFKNVLLLLVLLIQFGFAQNKAALLIDSLAIAHTDADKVRLGKKIAWDLKSSDWERALHYLEFTIETAKASSSEQLLAETYKTAGNIYYEKEVLDVALDYYQKAYNYYKNDNNLDEQFKLENDLAIIYAQLKNENESLRYFKNVYRYQLKNKDTIYLAQILNNIGTLYLDSEVDSSLVYYNKSLKLANQLNDTALNVYLFTNLARCYAIKNNSKKAKQYFNKSLRLLNQDSTLSKAWVYREFGDFYLQAKQSDSAVFYASKAVNLHADNPFALSNLKAVKTLYRSYLQKEDYKNASVYFEQYDRIRDSINLIEKALNVEKIKLQEAYKAKERIYSLQENQKRFKYFIIGLSLLSGVLVLGFLLFRYKNKLQKAKLKNALIESKTKELDASLELKNKELIAKAMTEIHRTEIIQDILKDLKYVKLKAVKKETQNAIDYILKRLEKDTSSNIWKEFEVRFEQVHESFYDNLYKKHPDLTPREKRLCALLKLNLTSKEIAQITGQSFKSVENSRTRLRKKLDLTNVKTDLSRYLTNI